ncbi:MAG: hypothetical protein F6J90_02480 [Moorea sp. SIOASIH]|uniref:hypothetical protein n=1 Tax=Moorena sp. SIOASIH TaxID=2607817 RepID=UPI0013BA3E19|nr:hypothetical protein [Moorena sp. SIOASIH]NEO35232.1 hypothetical protein [Moorena sp. SIOASIH]
MRYTAFFPCSQIRCSRLPTPDSRLPIPYSLLPIPYSLLPTPYSYTTKRDMMIC